MSFDKVNNILRMLELAGRPANADSTDVISENPVELTQEELDIIPFNCKKIVEGKIHVLGFENKLVLKAVNIADTEDKAPPKLNSIKDYEKDGGNAVKYNKKMIDNEPVSESRHHPVTDKQVNTAQKHLESLRSKLKDSTHESKDGETAKLEAEYEEVKKKLKRLEKEAQLLKDSKLKLAKESAEDATIFSGSRFTKDDEEEYLGLPEVRDVKVSLPSAIRKDANRRIKEIQKSIKDYDDKGYNDGSGANSNKNKAIDAIEQILDNLSSKDYEGFREAQLFFLTLMSPITDLLPASLVNFLSSGGPGPEGSDELISKVEPFETKVNESDDSKSKVKIRKPLLNIIQESKKGRKKKMNSENPCWDGYEMVGHKMKDGKEVPNCVPKK